MNLQEIIPVIVKILKGFLAILPFIWPFVFGPIIYLVCNHRRHRCGAEGCKKHTHSVYRLIKLNQPRTPNGFWAYAILKFVICRGDHVSVSMKTKLFSDEQLRRKPAEEFVLNDNFTRSLFEKAGIENPAEDYYLRTVRREAVTVPALIVVDPHAKKSTSHRQHHLGFLRKHDLPPIN